MTVHESYVRKRTISKKENNKDNRKEKIIVTISKMRTTKICMMTRMIPVSDVLCISKQCSCVSNQ